MAFSHPKPRTYFPTRIATENFQRSPNRPKDELKLPGTTPFNVLHNSCNFFTQTNQILILTFVRVDVIDRLRELHTLKGHVESVVKLKGLDIDTIQQHYTV